MPTLTRDAVVIGAGMSGLVAARELERDGFSVAVIESRSRVGGQLGLASVGGTLVETGPAWLAANHSATVDLARELGLSVSTPEPEGEDVYLGATGERLSFTGGLFPVPQASEPAMLAAVEALESLSAAADAELPGTLGEWLLANVADEPARAALELLLGGSHADGAAGSLPLVQALHLATGAGSVSNLVDRGFRAAHRVEGGLQGLASALQAELLDDVWLGREVSAVRVAPHGFQARAEDLSVNARAAILAVPEREAARLLGEDHGELGVCGAQGVVEHSLPSFTAHAVYPTAFWREVGLSGRGFGPGEAVQELQDESWPHVADASLGILAAHSSGEAAKALWALPEAARRRIVLESLQRYVGPAAATPQGYVETRREHGYGVSSVTFEGQLATAGDHLEGTGHRHVEGAVRSGYRAAHQVSAQLRGEEDPVSIDSSVSEGPGLFGCLPERES